MESRVSREQFSVRPLASPDIATVQSLEKESFTTTWQEGAFENELKNPCARYRVLCDSSQTVVGYAGYWLVDDEAHITSIAVNSRLRGRRLGQLLLHALLQQATSDGARWVTLEVRADNLPAQKLYRKFGFAKVGTRRQYYQGQYDGHVMWAGNLQSQTYRERMQRISSEITPYV